MILVDSNVPMYLVGADHPNKPQSRDLLAKALREGRRLVTDAEVFQEILHRYASLGRHDAIRPTFDVLLHEVDEVLPVTFEVMAVARDIVMQHRDARARDAVHVAVTRLFGIPEILSFDRGLDRIAGVRRYGA